MLPYLCRKVLQDAVLVDAMLFAQLQQQYVTTLLSLSVQVCMRLVQQQSTFFQNSDPIWFPHWPTCNVMISRGIAAACPQGARLGHPAPTGFRYMPVGGVSGSDLDQRVPNWLLYMSSCQSVLIGDLGAGSLDRVQEWHAGRFPARLLRV